MKLSIVADWRVDEAKGSGKAGFLNAVDTTLEVENIQELMEARINFHSTHGIFKDNIKTNDNFISADFLVFDFEHLEATQETLMKKFRVHTYGINASTNHMIDKGDGKGIIPRFHLCLPLKQPITSALEYKEVIKFLSSNFKIQSIYDESCVVASRYWKKQRETIHINDGKIFDPFFHLMSIRRNIKNKEELIKKEREEARKRMEELGEDNVIKSLESNKWYQERLVELNTQGSRHTAGCRIIGLLKSLGIDQWTASSILQAECSSEDMKHHQKTINNLYRKG